MKHYKYPRLTLLALSFVLAYILFTSVDFIGFRMWMQGLGLLGAFLGGVLYAYGFTAAIGTATFLFIAKDQPFILSGLLAGLGALLGDLVIFNLIRHDFMDEFKLLGREAWVISLKSWVNKNLHVKIRNYSIPLIGAFILASPLPDEIGVSLLATDKDISEWLFMAISFALNTIGIFALLYVGTFI